MADPKRTTGMSLPAGILQPTTPPEPEGQGGDVQADDQAGAKPAKARKKQAEAATGADVSDDGAKLYLSPDVRFRLRMLAYQRGKKISAVANEVLDKALPRWNLERTE